MDIRVKKTKRAIQKAFVAPAAGEDRFEKITVKEIAVTGRDQQNDLLFPL